MPDDTLIWEEAERRRRDLEQLADYEEMEREDRALILERAEKEILAREELRREIDEEVPF